LVRTPPTSGFFKLGNIGANEIEFIRSEIETAYGKKIPKRIVFEYLPASQVVLRSNTLNECSVIVGNDHYTSPNDLVEVEKKNSVIKGADTSFSFILLNPDLEPFKTKEKRFAFAEEYRKAYAETFPGSSDIDGSIFTRILPGYLSYNHLKEHSKTKRVKFSSQDFNRITRATISGSPSVNFELVMDRFSKNLRAENNILNLKSRQEAADQIAAGKLSIFDGYTGFWAFDPIGDLQMLFTPNMHMLLKGVWSNKSFTQELKELEAVRDNEKGECLEKINQFLFEDAVFNVIHQIKSYFIYSKLANKGVMAISMSEIAPWMLVND